MDIAQINAILPQLIISFGITVALLLIAVKRTQKIIQMFSCAVLLLAFISTTQLLFENPIDVTILIRVDTYGLFATLMILAASLVVLVTSSGTLNKCIEVHDEYYLLILLVVLGATIMVVSNHFASVFLGFELLSIALVGLVGYFREEDYSIESGFKYLILSATASSFMLLGMAFIYSQIGSLSLSPVFTPETSELLIHSNFYLTGIILFIVGIAFKLSLAPFHIWTPDVYQGSPTAITMILATVSKIAVAIVFIRYFLQQVDLQNSVLQSVLIVISILSMIVGNTLATLQSNIKRILAYSSIAHMGYLLIITVFVGQESVSFAWQAAMFYLFAYILATVALFYIVLKHNEKHAPQELLQTKDWQGLFWTNRGIAMLAFVSLLSLAGIPLTAGFIGKFYLTIHATINHSWYMLAGIVVGSGIGLYFYLKLVFLLFSNPIEKNEIENNFIVNYSPIFIYSLTFMTVAFGIYPDVLMRLISLN